MKRLLIFAAALLTAFAAPAAAQSPSPTPQPQTLCVSVTNAPPLIAGDLIVEDPAAVIVITVLDPASCIQAVVTDYDTFSDYQESRLDDLDGIGDIPDLDTGNASDWFGDIRNWGKGTLTHLQALTPDPCYQGEYDAFVDLTKAAQAVGEAGRKATKDYEAGHYSKALRELKKATPLAQAMGDARGVLDDTYDGDACVSD